jgi:hypothetical protein
MARTTIRTEDVTDSEVTTAKMATDPTNASNLASGTVGSARMGSGTASASTILYGDGSWKTEPEEYNDAAVLNDIATLALHSAVQNNQAAYNLSNAFIDQYEDGSGIDAETDTIRDSSGEYVWCAEEVTSAFESDSATTLLLHMDGANDGTTFTDSSSYAHTVTASGGAHTDTGTKKIGTASCEFISTPANKLEVTYSSVFASTGDFTWEFWFNSTDTGAKCMWDFRDSGGAGNQDHNMYSDWNSGATDKISLQWWGEQRRFVCTDATDGNWHHIAVVREDSTTANQFYFYYDGVSLSPDSGSMVWEPNGQDQINNNSNNLKIGNNFPENAQMVGFYDELRFSDNARYPGGTTFSPNQSIAAAASGNYTSATQTASATVSEMGIVVLYTNASGTATLNTDLIAAVSADGGSNYTTTTLTPAGTFSTGINIAVANSVSISNTGTAPKYKISFANQSAGVKETRVNGSALLY